MIFLFKSIFPLEKAKIVNRAIARVPHVEPVFHDCFKRWLFVCANIEITYKTKAAVGV